MKFAQKEDARCWPSNFMDEWNPRSLSNFQTFPRDDATALNCGNSTFSATSLKRGGKHGVVFGHSSKIYDTPSSGATGNFNEKKAHDVIEIVLGPNDRRFGFCVVGGADELLAPRISEIAPGSPAAKTDLEIGDLVTEVEGTPLKGATHAEIISMIHCCIPSRRICLRVAKERDQTASPPTEDSLHTEVENHPGIRLSSNIDSKDCPEAVDPSSSKERTRMVTSWDSSNGESQNLIDFVHSHSRSASQRSCYGRSTNISEPESYIVDPDYESHREMAVDVPDSFVARRKTPPRYPPLQTGCVNQGAIFEENDKTDDILNVLRKLKNHIDSVDSHVTDAHHQWRADLQTVEEILLNGAFQKALELHRRVQTAAETLQAATPFHRSRNLISECVAELQNCTSHCETAAELIEIFGKFSFEGLLYASDNVAALAAAVGTPPVPAKRSRPQSAAPAEDSEIIPQIQCVQKVTRVVKLDKTNDPLGATVKREGESIIIARIIRGGAAERSGLLQEGDEILEINGIDIRGKSVNEVCDLVERISGTVSLLIRPALRNTSRQLLGTTNTIVHLKALFDYDPEEDAYLPCKELGMSFQKGDILHVISQDDLDWWQAYREGEEDQNLPGLIPSKQFQQEREQLRNSLLIENMEDFVGSKSSLLCSGYKTARKLKTMSRLSKQFEVEDVLTYEEVSLFYPRNNFKRPVVLIGPPHVGRKEIREVLLQDSQKFAAAIPHTSRPIREGERNGVDYHFITRSEFETAITQSDFLEHGEYDKSYYGTTVEAVRHVAAAGKFCVLNLQPEALLALRRAKLLPFVIFIAPALSDYCRARSSRVLKDEELQETICRAKDIEKKFGHLFDMVVVNFNELETYNKILTEVSRLDQEPQWVPATLLDANSVQF